MASYIATYSMNINYILSYVLLCTIHVLFVIKMCIKNDIEKLVLRAPVAIAGIKIGKFIIGMSMTKKNGYNRTYIHMYIHNTH